MSTKPFPKPTPTKFVVTDPSTGEVHELHYDPHSPDSKKQAEAKARKLSESFNQ